MKKGVLGFNTALYVFLALFLSLYAGFQTTLLLIGFAILVEKDSWVTNKMVQTGAFIILVRLVDFVISFLIGHFNNLLELVDAYDFIVFTNKVSNFIGDIANWVLVLVTLFIALKIFAKKDFNLPLVSKLVK